MKSATGSYNLLRDSLIALWAIVMIALVVLTFENIAQYNEANASTPETNAQWVKRTMVPCNVEDGSGPHQVLPCYWLANERSNRIGKSYWIPAGNPEASNYFVPSAHHK